VLVQDGVPAYSRALHTLFIYGFAVTGRIVRLACIGLPKS
jgi:hypothetical protein